MYTKQNNKLNSYLLTVCKSRRNRINVTKPDKMTKGVKLNSANNFPNRLPENKW